MIRRDSGMELVEADFGTRRREDRRQNRGSNLIELPSDSHPDEFDSRRATLCMFDLNTDFRGSMKIYGFMDFVGEDSTLNILCKMSGNIDVLLCGRKGQLFIIGISSNIEMNVIIRRR